MHIHIYLYLFTSLSVIVISRLSQCTFLLTRLYLRLYSFHVSLVHLFKQQLMLSSLFLQIPYLMADWVVPIFAFIRFVLMACSRATIISVWLSRFRFPSFSQYNFSWHLTFSVCYVNWSWDSISFCLFVLFFFFLFMKPLVFQKPFGRL